MGDRGNVVIKMDEGGGEIFLYSHWSGTELPSIVAEALDRGRDRWDDAAYLARIIFCEMVKDDLMGTTGYGIATYPPDQEHPHINVDPQNRKVNSIPMEEFIAINKKEQVGS